MRDLANTSSFLDETHRKLHMVRERLQVLRTTVLANPTGRKEKWTFNSLHDWTFEDLVVLFLTLSREDQWFIELWRERIDPVVNRLPDDKQIILEILLSEYPAEAECYLIETSLWSCDDWFGNVISNKAVNRVTARLAVFLEKRKKAKVPNRPRGYKDKGSWAPEDVRIRRELLSEVAWFLHQKEESRRQIKKDTASFLKGAMGLL